MRPFARSRCDGPLPDWSRFWTERVLTSFAMTSPSCPTTAAAPGGRMHGIDGAGSGSKTPELQRARAFSTGIPATQATRAEGLPGAPGLPEQRAERIAAVDAPDGLAEDLGHGQLGDLPAGRGVLAQRNGVGHHNLFDGRRLQPLDRRPGKHRMDRV